MSIGIIGAGSIGSAIARALTRNGIAATLSNRRGPDALRDLVAEIGPPLTIGTVAEAARADLVFLAVPWSKIPGAVADLPPWSGRIVIDANNPIEPPSFAGVDLGGRVSTEVVASMLPGARVVKAFNHLQPPLLVADPRREGGRRVMFFSGDDASARREVAALINRLGFFGVDLGRIADGGRLTQFPGGPLPALNFVKFD
jgi:predicted dinucleotide-binding enzyme